MSQLKCSGDKDGCERCIANQLMCEYTRSNSRGSRRKKKDRRRSEEDTRSDVSPGPAGRTMSGSRESQKRSPTSQTRYLSPQQRHSPLPRPSPGSLSYQSAYDESQAPALDSIDFSVFTDADAFDLGSLTQSVDQTRLVTCGATSASYLAPVTSSPDSYDQRYDPSFRGYYQQTQFDHVTSSTAGHPQMATAGQGYAGDHEDAYMQYQHHQHAYQHSYWGSQRGGGR